MRVEQLRDQAALVATEVHMIGDDVMDADLKFGKASFDLGIVLDVLTEGLAGLQGVHKNCQAATSPLSFAHTSLQEKQAALNKLGLHKSSQDYVRDIPKRLGEVVARTATYADAAASTEKAVGELLDALRPVLEKMETLRDASKNAHTYTGGDLNEALQSYTDATEAFVQA